MLEFYTQETYLVILLASLPLLISIYSFFVLDKQKSALFLLLFGAFLLRFTIISLDPFLQEWDERFHALVAKNMMDAPFYPMLRVNPIFSYDYKAWCCNHIWVHKQPLFLWQMALSMKIFGVNEVALRLPSALMGTMMVFFTYHMGNFWTKNTPIAYTAALLMAFSYYQLELMSGRFSLDHNDLAFSFYVTASIWAFTKYLNSNLNSIKWVIFTGFLVGCAILIKWLTALLIFGGWGLYILQHKEFRTTPKYYIHVFGAFIVACMVFIPWQVYIINTFPLESSWTYELNRKHIFEALDGQVGGVFYHILFMRTSYGNFLLPFLLIGIIASFVDNKINKKLSISFLAMLVVIFGFFSLIVATKMGAFTYPVVSILFIFLAMGLNFIVQAVIKSNYFEVKIVYRIVFLYFLISIYCLKPWDIANHRSINNESRNVKIHNTKIYKSLDEAKLSNKTILNVKQFEDIELMFYKNINAYQWYPKSNELDSLQSLGHEFVTFKNHGKQQLPEYIFGDSTIQKMTFELR